MKLLIGVRSLALFFIVFTQSYSLLGQIDRIDFKDETIQDDIATIFATYEGIDSIRVDYFDGIPVNLDIYGIIDSIYYAGKTGILNYTFYNLNFEGDRFWVKKKYPMVYNLILSKNFVHYTTLMESKTSGILLTKTHSYIAKATRFSTVVATPRAVKIKEFTEYLNQNYSEAIKLTRDSVLILQVVVEREGTMGETELLYGERGKFYDFVFGTKESQFPFGRFFHPYLNNGTPRRSLADIYIRLNPDKTFTVSSTGRQRKLKIKNFKDDYNNPLFIF
ncbi:hypothetical protein [Sphingobacterium pedocola]|uniref:DUF5117 domain-containing protein n=1 Tax=Sphingobacterium pedocola TaxID=2082722 RepID=A0ABR9T7S1_9SPHI|nr:hypothetical protein [Sphingobacterium pedocola]MBE8721376.1 hypothetical protein [Sphingobacterium pedocola]